MGEEGKLFGPTQHIITNSVTPQSTVAQDDNNDCNSDCQPEDDLDPSDDELMKTIQSEAIDRGMISYMKQQHII